MHTESLFLMSHRFWTDNLLQILSSGTACVCVCAFVCVCACVFFFTGGLLAQGFITQNSLFRLQWSHLNLCGNTVHGEPVHVLVRERVLVCYI